MTQLNVASSLNVIEIIVKAFQVYRSRFNVFLITGFQSTIWFLFSALTTIPLLLISNASFLSIFMLAITVLLPSDSMWAYLILIVVALILIYLSVLCSAKGFTQQAIIARLAYQELSSLQETKIIAIQHTNKRFWQFWLVQLFINIRIGLASIFISFLNITFTSSNTSTFGFIGMTLIVISYIWQLRILATYFIADITIALDGLSALDSMRDCKSLSKGHINQISLIIFITSLITLPGYILAFSPAIISFSSLLTQKDFDYSSFFSIAANSVFFLGLGTVIAVVIHVLTIPLWQSLKAVIYHKLKEL